MKAAHAQIEQSKSSQMVYFYYYWNSLYASEPAFKIGL
jgi:hypothetical protein